MTISAFTMSCGRIRSGWTRRELSFLRAPLSNSNVDATTLFLGPGGRASRGDLRGSRRLTCKSIPDPRSRQVKRRGLDITSDQRVATGSGPKRLSPTLPRRHPSSTNSQIAPTIGIKAISRNQPDRSRSWQRFTWIARDGHMTNSARIVESSPTPVWALYMPVIRSITNTTTARTK